MAERKIILPTMDAEKVAKEIGDFVIDIVKSHNKTGCVMGLSGGVDSTVVASLIKRAFDNTNYELVGYVLPSSVNNPKDAEDGINVAEKLGLRYYVRPIEEIVKGYRFTNPNAFTTDPKNKFHRGNMMSEIRAGVLHLEGALERKSVAGTGNKDEDFGIGYYTLFGDGAVHFSPIGGLSKRLVREMARYLGFNDLANREPDAGLEVGETDFKALGYSSYLYP
jgi:NAD+ synthase